MTVQNQNARENMIKQQLRTNNILDDDLLSLITAVPREQFVPTEYVQFAFADMHIPIGHDQTMLTPLEEAQIIQALAIQPHETVLEIGSGTGYMTVLLAKLAKRVISVDYFADFTEMAKRQLHRHEITNVELITGDACRGWLELAPFDVIVSTGGHKQIADIFQPQLMPGGRMFAMVGESPVLCGQVLNVDDDKQWQHEFVFETDVAMLIDRSDKGDFVF